MCGIAALLGLDGGLVEPAQLALAADTIAHRGPDDEGFVLCGPGVSAQQFGGPATKVQGLEPIHGTASAPGYTVGLANRRLAIIDLSEAGHGPMAGADGAVWLTYNGEVYNYRELGEELASGGHRFTSRTDSEVVLAAYLEWGERFVERLNGMFALAIWDGRSNELLLARDRLGIKPLYVARIGSTLAAASEPKALLALGAPREVDWEVAYAYLVAGYADWGGRTFFRSIRQVEPATVEVIRPDGARRVRRYWSLAEVPSFVGSRAAAVATFRNLLLDSVRLQLRSDVPVGTALSGGLDSSGVVAAVATVAATGAPRHAFSAVFRGSAVDESRYAEAVATRYGVEWHTVEPTEEELLEDLDTLLRAQDEPFPSTSSYAQWRVMRLARECGVSVLLDGQGGDELLAGYRGFRPYAVADALRAGRVGAAVGDLWSCRTELPLPELAARSVAALAPRRLAAVARTRARRRSARFVAPELHERYEGPLTELEQAAPTLDGVLRRSLTLTTLPVLLRSEDRNSMAHSREARVPLLDHRLVEFAASLPAELKLDGRRTKVVLREALGDLLPPEVLARTDKLGFATPEADWLRRLGGGLVEETLRRSDGGVDRKATAELWGRLTTGDAAAAAPIWRIVCFNRWRSAGT